jgi:hypothetical protein
VNPKQKFMYILSLLLAERVFLDFHFVVVDICRCRCWLSGHEFVPPNLEFDVSGNRLENGHGLEPKLDQLIIASIGRRDFK